MAQFFDVDSFSTLTHLKDFWPHCVKGTLYINAQLLGIMQEGEPWYSKLSKQCLKHFPVSWEK